jgi:hypothetical protein
VGERGSRRGRQLRVWLIKAEIVIEAVSNLSHEGDLRVSQPAIGFSGVLAVGTLSFRFHLENRLRENLTVPIVHST